MNSGLRSEYIGLLMFFLSGPLLPDISIAQPSCVQFTNGTSLVQQVPITLGSVMRLKFRHSIYGSEVEEIFAMQHDGFHLTQLRYGEARLVDFYGHENARFDRDVWVVSPAPRRFQSLNLTTSAETPMSLYFENQSQFNPLISQSSGALRLTVASCERSAHG
jgi:hypothetical protein